MALPNAQNLTWFIQKIQRCKDFSFAYLNGIYNGTHAYTRFNDHHATHCSLFASCLQLNLNFIIPTSSMCRLTRQNNVKDNVLLAKSATREHCVRFRASVNELCSCNALTQIPEIVWKNNSMICTIPYVCTLEV